MNRVMFVDDEEFVLTTLRGFMRKLGDEWEAEFAGSGPKALELLEQKPFDIIVSDMRMPDMTGAELLNEVMRRHPRTARVVLSGYSDEQDVLRAIGVTHQWLAKPCPLNVLRSVLEGVIRFQQRLENPELKTLAGEIQNLPSVPLIYQRILDALQSPNSTTQTIGGIVIQDAGLAAKVLHLANSAFFGFAQSVSSPGEAVQLLGVNRIRSLALMHHVFCAFSGGPEQQAEVEDLRQHSLHTGWLAQQIVELEHGEAHVAEEAFTAGLLHDIGQLMLMAEHPAAWNEVRELARSRQCTLYQAEKDVLKTTHADLGAYLLTLWGLPLPLVEAVAFHHEPAESGVSGFSTLTAVHVANVWSREQLGGAQDLLRSSINVDYLKSVGVVDRLEYWRSQFFPE